MKARALLARSRLREYTRVRVDWVAIVLVLLFTVVIGGALFAMPTAVETGTESAVEGTSTGQQAAAGGVWVVAEVAFAVLLLLAILAWRRLPGWLQDVCFDILRVAFWMSLGAAAVLLDSRALFAGVLGIYVAIEFLDVLDLWWIGNDLLAIAIAIYGAVVAGIVLGPVILAVGLVGLTVYDHVFANRRPWMFDLASWTIRRRLPLLVIVPTRLRLDWDDVIAAATPDDDSTATEGIDLGPEFGRSQARTPATEPDGGEPGVGDVADEDELEGEGPIGLGIGMADLLLPAAFVVAIASTGAHWLALGGAIYGILFACGRLSYRMHTADRGGAGMPPLTVGALGGYAIGILLVVIL